MNVLFATVEMYPLAKVGGLGDVAGSLPKHLRKIGVDIRVAMPYHNFIDVDSKYLGDIFISGMKFSVYENKVNDIPVYLIKNNLLSKDKIYGYDDHIRWALFSQVVVELPKFLKWDVDIIHCNDWMTALSPLYAKSEEKNFKFLLTVHNLKHQGKYPLEYLDIIKIPEKFRDMVVWKGMINYMKAGVIFSDAVNTVSPTYAKEILTPEYGEGLEEILRKNSHKIYGILNGIDYDVWNPENDKNIYQNYCANCLEKKYDNKREMKKILGIDDDSPLFGFVARLVEQKGVDILIESIKKIKNAHFLILGTGRKYFEDLLIKNIQHNIHAFIKYDESLAHKIYASSDFFLMPSKFEPCGLGQMIAMRYGTIPVVRKTGGLADTVKDINEGGWGFVFEKYSSDELKETIERAIDFYNDGDIHSVIKKAMSLDFSWSSSAKEYKKLYSKILS